MLLLRRAVTGAVVATAFGMWTQPGHAQEAKPATEPAKAPAEPVHAGPDSPADPDTAKPAADMEPPPKDPTNPEGPKSEKAVLQAKEAELTPIVPSPRDVTRPAYQLFAETDLPLLGIGVVFGFARLVRTQPAYCAPSCDPATLNAIDRTTAGFWRPAWGTASDIALLSIAAGSAGLLLYDDGLLPALNDSVVIAESALTATAFTSIMTLAAGRPRPFLYGSEASPGTRNSADAGLSFLSSHAAISFALATSLYMTERRLRPQGSLPYIVFGVGLAAASFVGTARVMAGRHFITDAVGGAIVGTSVGVLVPALHGSPVRVVPVVAPKQGGLSVMGAF